MESPEYLTAKRRVLVEALLLCLDKSAVGKVVESNVIRPALDANLAEIWRDGEFQLEPIWKLLCQEPGLSAKEVAPPLLVFKAYEEDFDVLVRLPAALASIPRNEQVRLRSEVKVGQKDFAYLIKEIKSLAEAEALRDVPAELVDRSALPPSRTARKLTAVLAGVTAVSIGTAIYVTMHDPARRFDTADVASVLQLRDARKQEGAIVARIADPRWETLEREEQQRIANEIFDREAQKGVDAITLLDGKGEVRVIVTNLGGERDVEVR